MTPLILKKIWNVFVIIYHFVFLTAKWSIIAFFCGPRESFYGGSLEGLKKLKIQVALTGKHKNDISSFKGVILSTHKGWSDFYTLPALAFSSCVSRMTVAFVLPGAALVAHIGGCLLLFRRSGKTPKDNASKQKKIEDMATRYANWIANVNERLLIYPEGHRNPKRGLLALRSGTFRIAFEKKIPCLIAPAEGSEYILSEKSGFVHPDTIDLTKVFADKELKIFAPQNDTDEDGHRIPSNTNDEKNAKALAQAQARRYRGFFLYNAREIVDPRDYATFEEFQKGCEVSFVAGYEEVCARYDALVGDTTAKEG